MGPILLFALGCSPPSGTTVIEKPVAGDPGQSCNASGDLSLWVTMARSVVEEFDDPETFVRVITFSLLRAQLHPRYM